MKKHRFNYSILVCIFFTFLNSFDSFSLSNDFSSCNNDYVVDEATSEAIPKWVIENWETRTAATGIWVADNKNYKNEQEPYDAYALHWQYGIGNKHIKGRLYVIKNDEDAGTIWEFTEYWDPLDSKLKIMQIGSDGTLGHGEIWKMENGNIKELQTFTTPDGIEYSSGHISWMSNGVSTIESYSVKGEEWTKMRTYDWKLKKEELLPIPKEYKDIAYLIGTWEVPVGENKARMTFSWGKNKRTILYKNEFKRATTNKWVQENQGLITYNGIEDALVFITSYSSLNNPLMANGKFKFDEDRTIYREFTCHYKEGAGLPWSNGAKAPKGGKSIEFKQIWSPVDNNNFTGEFFWKKNGEWEHPIKTGSKIESWTKVLN
ncbi:hypothetical protein [Maribacter halichondriae]|uniref:hypothetical protein n=1 Tax=Maribacter halichondriae TaxID=2980554 RepID=UPI002359B0D8|nr:hypothetical protein [Maribacter sp. Hal144]